MKIYVSISGLYIGADRLAWRCLAAQTDLDFTVILIDPEHDPELKERAEHFSRQTGVSLIRLPYKHPPGARSFDWSQFNSPYLFAESEDDFIFRFLSWRLIPSNFISFMRQFKCTAGFQRYIVQRPPEFVDDYIFSTAIPVSGDDSASFGLDVCYGDYFMRVGDYLELNGLDEPLTTTNHFEDLDFEYRWRIACSKGAARPGIKIRDMMYNLDQWTRKVIKEKYNFAADVGKRAFESFRPPCDRCRAGKWAELQAKNDPNVRLADIRSNSGMVDLGRYFEKRWFWCRQCDMPMCHVGTPDMNPAVMPYKTEYRATIGLMKKWGRNLKKAREKALKLPMEQRIRYVRDSYADVEVLVP